MGDSALEAMSHLSGELWHAIVIVIRCLCTVSLLATAVTVPRDYQALLRAHTPLVVRQWPYVASQSFLPRTLVAAYGWCCLGLTLVVRTEYWRSAPIYSG